jgi:hypothetical protein
MFAMVDWGIKGEAGVSDVELPMGDAMMLTCGPAVSASLVTLVWLPFAFFYINPICIPL